MWRNTLDWFDAIKIGLTATPAQHTAAYFENMPFGTRMSAPSTKATSSTTT